MVYTFGEIPTDIKGRYFLPLASNHLWKMYQELGWERGIELIELLSSSYLYDGFKWRMDESILTSEQLMRGTLPTIPEKTMTYLFFPATLSAITYLQQGFMKLVYGNSVDAAYVCVNDMNMELAFILNVHAEDGIPVDWWIMGPDDELMDRRHHKLGIKIRDLPKKSKNITECGQRITDILKDVRNERAPQWTHSDYLIAGAYGSAAVELYCEQSNYEEAGTIWNGLNAKRIFGLHDHWFTYIPNPSILNMFIMSERSMMIKKLVGLTTGGNFFIHHVEPDGKQTLKRDFPELFDIGIERVWREEGIPLPAATLGVKYPELKKKSTWEKEEFDWKYPKNARFLKSEDVGMTIEEACNGILFDIDHEHEMDMTLSEKNIISTGIGTKTKVWK